MATSFAHTIARIVKTRSTTTPKHRPLRPDTAEAFFQDAPARPRRSELDGSGNRPRRRRVGLIVGIVVAVLLVAGAVVAVALTMPRITGVDPTDLTKERAPELRLTVSHPFRLAAGKVDATIDGEQVARDAISVQGGDTVVIDSPSLDDGSHDVRVAIDGVGVLGRELTRSWTLVVDTTAPKVRVTSPKPATAASTDPYDVAGTATITSKPFTVKAATEAGASFTVRSSLGTVEAVRAGRSDATFRTASIALPEGRQELVVQSTDAAGNSTETRLPVVVDTTGPAMLGKVPSTFTDNTLGLKLTLTDAHGAKLAAKLDGVAVADGDLTVLSQSGAPKATSDDDTAPATGDAADEEAADDEPATDRAQLPTKVTYQLKTTDPVYEGRHTLELTSTDSLGETRSIKRTFIVNAAETLDDAAGIKGGAIGKDVTALQVELIKQGATTKAALGAEFTGRSYGMVTKNAVAKLQADKGLPGDGVAGADTLAALTLQIVIDQSSHSLTLMRSGKVVKTYGVAVGAAEFPTPNGTFKIQSKQKDPTWTPPDSDWAKDAKPIGPGKDNPLGTRWMGIDGTVGIHGTNSPDSIGFSVSHGCIRMAIPDVEDLFERVRIGTPVVVQA